MIQPGKSFLKFECGSNKVFKKYEDFIPLMGPLWYINSYFFPSNDVIVFPANQSKKNHKKSLEKRHEMNSKRKIQRYQLFLIF